MKRWWNVMSKGFLLVISGPSGVGKGTVCDELLKEVNDVVMSVSATTREMRPGEVDGESYFFVDDEKFEDMVKNEEFLEHANVHAHKYGTPKKFVFDKIKDGEVVILEIDVQGALQVKKVYDEAVFIMLLPPSMVELKNRIVGRNTETEEAINLRMSNAFKELDFVTDYDYFVVNDTVHEAVQNIKAIIDAEKHRVKRFKYIKEKVLGEKDV